MSEETENNAAGVEGQEQEQAQQPQSFFSISKIDKPEDGGQNPDRSSIFNEEFSRHFPEVGSVDKMRERLQKKPEPVYRTDLARVIDSFEDDGKRRAFLEAHMMGDDASDEKILRWGLKQQGLSPRAVDIKVKRLFEEGKIPEYNGDSDDIEAKEAYDRKVRDMTRADEDRLLEREEMLSKHKGNFTKWKSEVKPGDPKASAEQQQKAYVDAQRKDFEAMKGLLGDYRYSNQVDDDHALNITLDNLGVDDKGKEEILQDALSLKYDTTRAVAKLVSDEYGNPDMSKLLNLAIQLKYGNDIVKNTFTHSLGKSREELFAKIDTPNNPDQKEVPGKPGASGGRKPWYATN